MQAFAVVVLERSVCFVSVSGLVSYLPIKKAVELTAEITLEVLTIYRDS